MSDDLSVYEEAQNMYAPIIIITLCRYEHFKECVESLVLNQGACESELYIAIDYPSKDEHWDGYEKICRYCSSIQGFKSVHVIKRQCNFGAAKNFLALRRYIWRKYDRFIFTEDDNVFSPNFLLYMNKGFEKFKQDDSVFAVSGYSYSDQIKYSSNTFWRQSMGMPAWGYGEWRSKSTAYENTMTRSYCLKKVLNPVMFLKAATHSWSTLLFLVMKVIKPSLYTDNTMSVYLFFEKKEVILPVVSKVRNMGHDGSGEHCGVDPSYGTRKIDQDLEFEYVGSGLEFHAENSSLLLKGKREYMTFLAMLKHIWSMTVLFFGRK
ncbi:glycosyltransferase family A protein [Desulfosediminicola flagellatus]|uniref:glycosyltransferase family A protein n=1 Tax=Desulfosediminicola flagellatus TaxID=2569541 RepID=UPI0010AC9D3A|nr:glycosyltransferase family A protein [Desulfosediminicola flagellatus]